jgi:hypothetical protein
MALHGNNSVLLKNPARCLGGVEHSGYRNNFNRGGANQNFRYQDGATTTLKLYGQPSGYNPLGHGSWVMPQKGGAISSHNSVLSSTVVAILMQAGINISGEITTSTLAEAIGQLVASAIGQYNGSTAASANILAALLGSGTITCETTLDGTMGALGWVFGESSGDSIATLVSYATGKLVGEITPFTELSPQNLAAAVWDGSQVETSLSAREAMRLIAAALAGKISGAEGTTVTINNAVDDDKQRIVAIVDGDGNRTSITYDVT